MVNKDSFIIFVFSFNRGQFLLNCIRSIEESMENFRTCIIDDNSTDKDTRLVLDDLSQRYEILSNERPAEYEHKTGGLAGSMNIAMEYAKRNGYEYAIFIQDDMQVVRRVLDNDLSRIVQYFSSVPNSIQISTCFLLRVRADTFLEDHYIDETANAYIRKKETERGKSNFSATGVFSVERFHRIFGKFLVGETTNSEKARALGLTRGVAIFPFMCWLPYPVSYRGKRKSLRHRFFEHFGRCGYYPFNMMSNVEQLQFVKRDPVVLPVMETFLNSPTAPRQDNYQGGGGAPSFIAYGGVMTRCFSAAVKLKHWLFGRSTP